jgi:hypothetical protein
VHEEYKYNKVLDELSGYCRPVASTPILQLPTETAAAGTATAAVQTQL